MLGRMVKDLFASKVRLPGQIDFEAGVEAYKAGKLAVAAEHFAETLRAEPEHVQAHNYAGAIEAARECCETALALDPELALAHDLLASLDLPGPDYLEVISMFHSPLRPRAYLEIGVESGQSIALARRETRAIGIDPEPKIT